MTVVHVVPVDDLLPHVEDIDNDCPCEPDHLIEDGGIVVVHHSYDGRELLEEDHA